jgi:hypothetical protein
MPFSPPVGETETMRPFRLKVSLAAAALFAQSAVPAIQEAQQPGPAKSAGVVPKNQREWKRLRAHARTPEQLRALAQWCEAQAAACRRSQADCEAELRELTQRPNTHPFPANPPRDHILRTLIAHYRKQAVRWMEFAHGYSQKAEALETPASGR